MQNILVVMEKSSFLPMSMIEQLKELEYNTVSAGLDIQELSKLKDTYEVVLLSCHASYGEVRLSTVSCVSLQARMKTGAT